ncbi:hypothetical protein CO083_06120 [Candidatus Roizmanbacteria bacterium CG_4_9_14_0_8_um_filter_34_12]|uniref:ABC transporter permease n=4 Tax=Candidatus Roizmaniibacteriota TaxID=1752723 RepID=A0A2M8DB34_9BACT|nr:MAG: hypothetical protein CO083_06120 [Candidatus Roizmanbacteria bacterium CG_4_9_14_0_8_um_filter_34_12]
MFIYKEFLTESGIKIITNMKKIIRLFLLFSRNSLRTTLQAHTGIWLFMLGKIFRFAFFFLMIVIIFGKIKIISGYSFSQMLVFYLTFNLIDTFAQTMFREVYRFRYQVVSGNFDLTLVKPFHPFVKILIGGVDFFDLLLLFPYLFLTIYFAFQIPNITVFNILNYSFLILNSLIIATSFHIIVLALGILTTDVDHTIMIYRDLTGMARFPMQIYREPLRSIFTFIIPVGVMMTFPSQALFGRLSFEFFFLAFFISTVVLLLSLALWKTALKKYQSWGG